MVEIGLIKGKNSNIWQEPHEERNTFLVFLRIHYASVNRNGRMVRISLFYMGLLGAMGSICYEISSALHINVHTTYVYSFFVQSSCKITCFLHAFSGRRGISNRIPYEISVQERRDEEMKLVFAVLLCLVAVFLQPLKGM